MNALDAPRAVLYVPDPGAYQAMHAALAGLGVAGYAAETPEPVAPRAQRADTLLVVVDATDLADAEVLALVAALREEPKSREVPVGVVAAPERQAALLAAGATAVVAGPLTPGAAWTLLQRLARRAGGALGARADKHRARLKIYLGAAPGVGKTVAMLHEAHDRLGRGEDVVVALVETHGRAGTEGRLAGLPVVPRRTVAYRGAALTELDLDAVLARRPALVLVDELAHTNVPGSVNAKRHEDVAALRLAGIPVLTTLNVQHLEGLNAVVERLTGVKVRETVPDGVLDEAAEVVLVDLPPEALQRRLQAGQIYAPEKVTASLANFFTTHNLAALRELVLRELADQVDERLTNERQAATGIPDRLLVCVGVDGAEALIRRGARLADRLNGALVVLHVEDRPLEAAARAQLEADLALAERLTAEVVRLRHPRPGEAIARWVAAHPVTLVLVGRSRRPAWRRWLWPGIGEGLDGVDVLTVS